MQNSLIKSLLNYLGIGKVQSVPPLKFILISIKTVLC